MEWLFPTRWYRKVSLSVWCLNKERPEGNERKGHVNIWGNIVPGRGNNRGPELWVCLENVRISKELGVGGAKWAVERPSRIEVRKVLRVENEGQIIQVSKNVGFYSLLDFWICLHPLLTSGSRQFSASATVSGRSFCVSLSPWSPIPKPEWQGQPCPLVRWEADEHWLFVNVDNVSPHTFFFFFWIFEEVEVSGFQ